MSSAALSRNENLAGPREISILINSICYFINSVFIISNNDDYQLVAIHNGKLLIDKPYKTLRGAKIAFARLFGNRSWKEDLKANWSIFYKPDTRWLKERWKGIRIRKW